MALTQFFGIVFVITGASIVMSRKGLNATLEEAYRNRGFLWLLGFFALVMGSAFVILNNIWTSGLPLLVTVISWIILLKGCFILLFPDSAVSLYKKCNKNEFLAFLGVIVLLIGIALLYLGFM